MTVPRQRCPTQNRERGGVHTSALLRREEAKMEELQKVLITKIGEQLKADKTNVQLLDVLNRLLGTVSNFIISSKGG